MKLLSLFILTILLCGCTTKAKIVDGKMYTQTYGSNEWTYEGEADPNDYKQSNAGEKAIGLGLFITSFRR